MKKLCLLLCFFGGKLFSQDIKIYQNYDFIPGDSILFEDNFRDDQDGEFPSHWKLEGGQGVINKVDDDEVFAITKYYSLYSPLMKNKTYLPAQYTIEFDTWLDAAYDSNEGMFIEFRNGADKIGGLYTNHSYFKCDFTGGSLQGDLPSAIANEAYHNKWHHIAIAVKDKQIKVYCDQYRVLTVPDCNFTATSIAVGGNASDGMNMLFKNVRLAEGGNMNMIGKAITDGKYIARGIHFDVSKAVVKPESMGEINAIIKALQASASLSIEIAGHTDGDDAANMALSQQRADAVKALLVAGGINASRLTAKGYGETKPVAPNSTPEGKANNRRVEFMKM